VDGQAKQSRVIGTADELYCQRARGETSAPEHKQDSECIEDNFEVHIVVGRILPKVRGCTEQTSDTDVDCD
jgi:hypothetical protein